MADPQARLSVLVDPPLAPPPSVAELERRAKGLRRRTAATRGGLAAAVAALLAGAGMALMPGDSPQTLQTAAPPPTTAGAGTQSEPQSATVPVKAFEVDGQAWTLLATRTSAPEVCFTLRSAAGEELKPACLALVGGALKAGAADLRSVSFVYGIVAPDATAVTLSADGNGSRLDVLGAGTGFPVNFVATVVGPSVQAVDLTASRNGTEERVSVPLPDHGRVSPPAPSPTTVTTTRPASTQPSTTLAPDTPVSTVVPPPAPPTTIAPGGGQAKRVQPIAGATDLRKQPFQSATAAGGQSVAVRFWSGVEPCSVLGRVDVTEAADRVTITLWTGTGPGAGNMACIQLAALYETIVQLQAPLAGRTVVDGAA